MDKLAHNWRAESRHDPNVGIYGHDVAVGHGRSPRGIPRWSPHFRARPPGLVCAPWEESDDDGRTKPDVAGVDGLLVRDEMLQR